jgi:hypothetical protein
LSWFTLSIGKSQSPINFNYGDSAIAFLKAIEAIEIALALRHSILPKSYSQNYQLPECLFTDGVKNFCSNHLEEIATQLGFICNLRDRPSEGGIVNLCFLLCQAILD